MGQQRRDPVETCEENPEEEDTVGMQEDVQDTQVGDSIEGQESGEEISVDKDCLLGIEFPFNGELFGNPGKLRAHLTRAEEGRHNQQWTRLNGGMTTVQLQKDKEQQAMAEMRPDVPKSNRMEMSHTPIKLETVMAESKQHALELETMRQNYETWMKITEYLTYKNELLKWEI